MPRPILPPWLRRALEAAIVAAIAAIAYLAGDRLAAGGAAYPLPAGLPAALLLGPAVLVLGVLTTAYPIAMAATRGDAILGGIAAWLIAADLTVVFAGADVLLEPLDLTLPAGALVGLLAAAPVAAGIAASQAGASFGFGRRAGAMAALTSAVAALIVLGIVAAIH